MRKSQNLIPISSIFFLILPTLSLAGQFTVTRVYDGDILRAKGHDIEIKVRLVGIDAPETSKKKRDPGQPYSQQVNKYLTELVLNKTVDINGYGLDPYSRILGVIFLNGKNINLEMIKAGLDEVYRGKPPHGFDITRYRQAEPKHKKRSEECGALMINISVLKIGDVYNSEEIENGRKAK